MMSLCDISMVKKPLNNVYTWKIEKFSALDKPIYSQGFAVQGDSLVLLGDPVSEGKGLDATCVVVKMDVLHLIRKYMQSSN
ncbi:hypothetical protein EPI10_030040 [Gossypium australe]|uniref:Uncharacterized protein n=1 Tax=Gossypium australe TaxID=47621 RepID=A0A5B6WYU4_9ROSI|nr:hypothetical protein EPI10_030040 [Gossypium australe]